MVELRKRKTPSTPAPPPPTSKKPSSVKGAASKAASKVKEAVTTAPPAASPAVKNGAVSAGGKPSVGDVIDLQGFGGEVETHEGVKTTLKELVGGSEGGVVLFTYPKASTPGCKFFFFFLISPFYLILSRLSV